MYGVFFITVTISLMTHLYFECLFAIIVICKCTWHTIDSNRSFIQILKRVTDKAELCGTPALTARAKFKDYPIYFYCLLSIWETVFHSQPFIRYAKCGNRKYCVEVPFKRLFFYRIQKFYIQFHYVLHQLPRLWKMNLKSWLSN